MWNPGLSLAYEIKYSFYALRESADGLRREGSAKRRPLGEATEERYHGNSCLPWRRKDAARVDSEMEIWPSNVLGQTGQGSFKTQSTYLRTQQLSIHRTESANNDNKEEQSTCVFTVATKYTVCSIIIHRMDMFSGVHVIWVCAPRPHALEA